jgi:uncharacterized protein YecE (DUF72 family)
VLPAHIYLGTSSWNFPEWKGLVYRRSYGSAAAFKREAFSEYAQIPWFRTVCIDSFFYTPATPEKLKEYAAQVPDGFRWVAKAWERLTIPRYPSHSRYGALAGKENPEFLSQRVFEERIAPAFDSPEVMAKTGPIVFQFGYISSAEMTATAFIGRLRRFLGELPKRFMFAVEVRNREFLCPAYFDALNQVGATHTFNHWNQMPPLSDQMKLAAAAGGLSAPFFVGRLLTPLSTSYEEAEGLFSPYCSIQQPNETMRRDVLRLIKRAGEKGIPVWITANNKAEGCSPLTMLAIARAASGSGL